MQREGAGRSEHLAERERMVEVQLRARGIHDPRVIEAMRDVPRHRFVPDRLQAIAYDDGPLPIGHGQTISQPYMVALMSELLELGGGERVLEVGTGSGYQTAVLAMLAREVVTIERIGALSERAASVIGDLGLSGVTFLVGDGTRGHPGLAPYDRILVTAGAPAVPGALLEQLQESGILEIPVGSPSEQVLKKIRLTGGTVRSEDHVACVFVPLVGEEGYRSPPGG